MAIQTNTWICEECGVMVAYSQEVSPWDDPVVIPPEDWEYIGKGCEEKYVCAVCFEKKAAETSS